MVGSESAPLVSSVQDIVILVALAIGAIMCLASSLTLFMPSVGPAKPTAVVLCGLVLIGLSVWKQLQIEATAEGFKASFQAFERNAKEISQSAIVLREAAPPATTLPGPPDGQKLKVDYQALLDQIKKLDQARENTEKIDTTIRLNLPFGSGQIANPAAEGAKNAQIKALQLQGDALKQRLDSIAKQLGK